MSEALEVRFNTQFKRWRLRLRNGEISKEEYRKKVRAIAARKEVAVAVSKYTDAPHLAHPAHKSLVKLELGPKHLIPQLAKKYRRNEFRRDGKVYFAYAKTAGIAKIGFTKGNVKARIAQWSTGCPYPVDLLFWIPGSRSLESAFHEVFGNARTTGEWFCIGSDELDSVRFEFNQYVRNLTQQGEGTI